MPDVPEVRDDGDGRATAALRAVLQAYGVTFDAAALLRECNVDEDGASIDDLEDVAVKYGLEAGSVIAPTEHVLLPEARMLPALVVAESPEDEQDFVVVWRLDGDKAQIMDPLQGRTWVPRTELQKRLHVHEMTMPADEYREAMAAPSFGEALQARARALGTPPDVARSLFDKAAADQTWRGLAALDASIRKLEAAPGADAGAKLPAVFGCAFENRCEGVDPVSPSVWSAQPAGTGPQGDPQLKVRGAVLLAIAGRAAPPPDAASP